jgi:hypothetical protein
MSRWKKTAVRSEIKIFYFSVKLKSIPKMVQILHHRFIYLVSHFHSFVSFLVININQKSNHRKTKTFHVNYPINVSYKEIYIDEILRMINDNDRCDRVIGVLYVSLTDKRLYNQIKPSCQTNQPIPYICICEWQGVEQHCVVLIDGIVHALMNKCQSNRDISSFWAVRKYDVIRNFVIIFNREKIQLRLYQISTIPVLISKKSLVW